MQRRRKWVIKWQYIKTQIQIPGEQCSVTLIGKDNGSKHKKEALQLNVQRKPGSENNSLKYVQILI